MLQAVATARGHRAVVEKSTHKDRKGNIYYKLGVTRNHSANGIGHDDKHHPYIDENDSNERVWCVTTDSTYIVTRRNGRTMVMGNSKGFDVPDIQCMIGARPFKTSFAAHMQQLGRGHARTSGQGIRFGS